MSGSVSAHFTIHASLPVVSFGMLQRLSALAAIGMLLDMTYPITPVELARELGHEHESRPGSRVRAFLRARYPDHASNERWLLNEDQADEARAFFSGNYGVLDPAQQASWLAKEYGEKMPVTSGLWDFIAQKQREGIEDSSFLQEFVLEMFKGIIDLESRLIAVDASIPRPPVAIELFGRTFSIPQR